MSDKKVSDLLVMDAMATRNLDIAAYTTVANMTGGTHSGKLTMVIDSSRAQSIMRDMAVGNPNQKYLAILFLVNQEQYKSIKEELSK